MGAFGFGLPNINLGSGGGAGFDFSYLGTGVSTPERNSVPVIPTPTVSVGSWGDFVSSAISTGLSAWKTQLNANLLEAQIKRGQQPSIVAGPNGTPSAPYTAANGVFTSGSSGAALGVTSSGNLIIYAVIAIVLLLLFKR